MKIQERLDHTKPYGFCFGSSTRAKYYQNGFYFDSRENVVRELIEEKQTKEIKEKVSQPVKQAKEKKEETPKEAPKMNFTYNGVDLSLWLTGEENHPWFKVQAALKEHWAAYSAGDLAPQTKSEAVEALKYQILNGKFEE